MILAFLFLILIPVTTPTLTIDTITNENGYSIINMGETEIVQDTKIILHLINIQDLRHTIDAVERNIQFLKLQNDPIIRKQIETIKAKVRTIGPNPLNTRQKRGLLNVIGKASNYLFGVMDDDDRQNILEHVTELETNNENTINVVNKQIEINQSFNESIKHFKEIIETDRIDLSKSFSELKENEKQFILKQIKLDQILKLNMLEEKINQIIDNIALIKHGLIHPSLLTLAELTDTKLDILKLKNIKVGTLKYNNETLVIAIKIPNNYEQIDLKLIVPVPNKQNLEIQIQEYYFIELNKTMYHYQNDVQYKKDLIVVNNCITNKNCTLKENYNSEIKRIDESTIICKNLKNENIVNKCDDRKIKLEGNYLITINNCSIYIFNETITNKNMYFVERFYYDETENYNFTKQLNFEEIILKNVVNLKPIKQLKLHKNIHYVIGTTTIIIICILLLIFVNMFKKYKKVILLIKEKETPKILENFNVKGGEVTYPTNSTITSPISIFSQ